MKLSLVPRVCLWCGAEFRLQRGAFCSDYCRDQRNEMRSTLRRMFPEISVDEIEHSVRQHIQRAVVATMRQIHRQRHDALLSSGHVPPAADSDDCVRVPEASASEAVPEQATVPARTTASA